MQPTLWSRTDELTGTSFAEPGDVSRHGRPCAMIGPVADGARLYPLEMPNLANYLLSLPEALETERDATPLRGIDLA